MIDLSLMSVDNIIIHQVPSPLQAQSPVFGTQLIVLETGATNELIRRVTDVMGRGSNCVEMRWNDTSDISAVSLAISILQNHSANTFIAQTSALARKLFNSMSNNRIPGGILVCLAGRTGAAQLPYIALIKAEGETGFHISSPESIEFLADLFLTKAQRLYKIGFLVQENVNAALTPDDISVHIFDQNAVHNGTASMATYFSQTFLGCAQLENAARNTELFYNITKDFIAKNPALTDEKKVDLTSSLHSYLKSNQSAVVSGQVFADTYFEDPAISDQYASRLTQDNFPAIAVAKDISRIKNKLKARKVKFNSGVRITFPSPEPGEGTDGLFIISDYNQTTDYTQVKIKGRVESQ